jgi:hypothetical protein
VGGGREGVKATAATHVEPWRKDRGKTVITRRPQADVVISIPV